MTSSSLGGVSTVLYAPLDASGVTRGRGSGASELSDSESVSDSELLKSKVNEPHEIRFELAISKISVNHKDIQYLSLLLSVSSLADPADNSPSSSESISLSGTVTGLLGITILNSNGLIWANSISSPMLYKAIIAFELSRCSILSHLKWCFTQNNFRRVLSV